MSTLAEPKSVPARKLLFPPAYLLFGFLAVVVAYLSVRIGVGMSRFSYTLDDPLIHLRLAQQIAAGHYGINSNEFSSPSSSILWPFLLVPTVTSAAGLLMPLCINVFCVAALLFLAYRWFGGSWVGTIQIGALVLLTNSIGLIFTGMEHNLQVLLTVSCAIGALIVERTGKVSPWFMGALILGPLIRYENLGITVLLAIYLFVRGHRREAATVLGVTILAVAGFSLFLHSLGLGLLPNSVMAKSSSMGSHSLYKLLIQGPSENIKSAKLIFAFEAWLVAIVFLGCERRYALGWVALAALIMHITLGRYGWLDRYECYINGFLLVLALRPDSTLVRQPVPALLAASALIPVAMGCIIGRTYFFRARAVPGDSGMIYSQQVQMHHFVDDYWKAPVAVNDLGWVSWNNPNFVLDLYGLGSSDALKLRTTSGNPAWMDRLCKLHQVHLVMLYQDWFPHIPANWIRVARLIRPPGGRQDVVSFFVTDPNYWSTARAELQQFAPKLPARAGFTFDPAAS